MKRLFFSKAREAANLPQDVVGETSPTVHKRGDTLNLGF
jgi:hypothetical protein